MNDLMDKIVALCKRRGFIFPGSEIYGGLSNSWDYGPTGVELKNNIKQLWWERFVRRRDDIVGLDAALIMNPKIWVASGHVANFTDPLVECKNCHARFRFEQESTKIKYGGSGKRISEEKTTKIVTDANQMDESTLCPNCGKTEWTNPRMFNLMFKTYIGPAEETANIAYLRPETAQAIFVDFKNIVDTTRIKIPFGIAQIGKAFRNEITPGNFLFRVREFEQMEIEYFFAPPNSETEWQEEFEDWRREVHSWIKNDLGLDDSKIAEYEVPDKDRAHYSKRTIDFMYKFPFGTEELYGLAYRGDFDLKSHEEYSKMNLKYRDSDTGEEYLPHVIEPSFGVDRSVLAVLLDAYTEENGRVYLKLHPKLAPYKAAVFPLLGNKPDLTDLARKIYTDLKENFMVAWDDRGNIGKRYASQDEIGTPFCITVDFDSLEDEMVTVRDRDSAKQERVKIVDLKAYLSDMIK